MRRMSGRKRQPRLREDGEVQRDQRAELAIVDRTTWLTVLAKLAEHAASYQASAGARGGVLHQRTNYLLSGLLRCACCGSLMQISAGTSARYYRCSANRKRGTCTNGLAVKEHGARECILAAVGDALWNPGALEHIRAHVAERLGDLSRALDAELKDGRARLARTEERIRSVAMMQIDGDRSPTLATMRRDFEAQAVAERGAIAELETRAGEPIRLPLPQELVEDRILTLDALNEAHGDVLAAREQLRRLFVGGAVTLTPEDGVYVARAELLLEAVLREKTSTPAQGGGGRCPRVVARGGFEPPTFGL